MKNGNTKPIDTFVELGTQVIVRDKVFSQDANDVGFRRAIAGVSTFNAKGSMHRLVRSSAWIPEYARLIIFLPLFRISMSPIKCSN